MNEKVILPLVALCLTVLTSTVFSQSQTLVYTNAFEQSAGDNWSKTNLSVTPKGNRTFLGQFSSESVKFILSNLPSHNSLTVRFDLYVIRSWDGNGPAEGPDIFQIQEAQTNSLIETTFATHEYYDYSSNGVPLVYRMQAYPGSFPSNSYPWSTGCREANTLGYDWVWPRSLTPRYNSDCVYQIAKTFSHSATSLDLSFAKISSTTDNVLLNESWGLDNFSIVAMTVTEGQGPVIVAEPESVHLSEDGDGTAFTVSAVSIGPMSYQWYHGGTPIAGATNNFCVITNFAVGVLGEYQVLIANEHGITLSEAAQFSVEAPVIKSGPTNLTRYVGAANAMFSVFAAGAGNLRYQWFQNGIALTDSISIKGADSAVLTIRDGIEQADAGEYRVAIKNFAGMTNSASATLAVLTPPVLELIKAVKPSFSNLTLTTNYQMQISGNLNNWTNHGAAFPATNTSMVWPNYFDVDAWGSLYFRLKTVP